MGIFINVLKSRELKKTLTELYFVMQCQHKYTDRAKTKDKMRKLVK